MSQHLEKLQVGDKVDFKGPLGKIAYSGHGKFWVKEFPASGDVTRK
jgi:hypothetical protein